VIPASGALEVGGPARQTFRPGSAKNIIQAADPCLITGSDEGSSLVFAGPGGVPACPNQHVTLFFDGDRFDRVWMPEEKKSTTCRNEKRYLIIAIS
jgi:hypothetical protein